MTEAHSFRANVTVQTPFLSDEDTSLHTPPGGVPALNV
jgi:hypothetical protein